MKPRVRQKTYQDYDAILQRYIRPRLGDRVLVLMRPMDIQITYHGMIERGLSPRTVRYTHAVMVSAAAGVAMASVARESCRWCQNPAAAERRNAFTHCGAGASFSSGCSGDSARPSEYLALKWQDLDWARQTVECSETRWEMVFLRYQAFAKRSADQAAELDCCPSS